ncbi:MAG: hypothetical protein JNK53_04380, partial [Phycisphaerae bacterium]|nr:hypothetical protein [Phycisphaerae bacterium]
DVNFLGTGYGQNVDVWFGAYHHTGFAGQLMLGLTNSTGGCDNGVYTAYCSELNQFIGGNYQYDQVPVAALPDPGPPMGAARADAIARMWYGAAGAQYGTDSDFTAAFQVAIWEIEYDWTGLTTLADLSSGGFTGSGFNANMLADLNFLFGLANGNGLMSNLCGLSNHDRQDQIIEVPGPGSLALLGVLGIILPNRRRS